MNSAYIVCYQGKQKITRHFTEYHIVWFEKRGNDVIFRCDGENYIVKNCTTTKFKEKFKGGTKDEI